MLQLRDRKQEEEGKQRLRGREDVSLCFIASVFSGRQEVK